MSCMGSLYLLAAAAAGIAVVTYGVPNLKTFINQRKQKKTSIADEQGLHEIQQQAAISTQ